MEEGEIVDEYEDISSEEEFTLRERIAELEARDRELQQIDTIAENSFDYVIEKGIEYGKENLEKLIEISDEEDEAIFVNTPAKHSNKLSRKNRIREGKKRENRIKSPAYSLLERSEKYRRKKHVKIVQKNGRKRKYAAVSKRTCMSSESESEDELVRKKLLAACRVDIRNDRCRNALKDKLSLINQSQNKENEVSRDIMEDEDDVDELQLRLIALQSKQEIREIAESEATTEKDEDEQELRLEALKSAVVKKHEKRKKQRLENERPYSPTDHILDNPIMITPSSDDLDDLILIEEKPVLVEIESSTESEEDMEISPVISPIPEEAEAETSLQLVDMDLVSSGDSKSPTPIDIPIENNVPLEETVAPETVEENKVVEEANDEEEDALRALLLAKMTSSSASSPVRSIQNKIVQTEESNEHEEAEELRNLLLSSLKTKKTQPEKVVREKPAVQNVPQIEEEPIILPETQINLKNVVKRIQDNVAKESVESHNKLSTVLENKIKSFSSPESVKKVSVVNLKQIASELAALKNKTNVISRSPSTEKDSHQSTESIPNLSVIATNIFKTLPEIPPYVEAVKTTALPTALEKEQKTVEPLPEKTTLPIVEAEKAPAFEIEQENEVPRVELEEDNTMRKPRKKRKSKTIIATQPPPKKPTLQKNVIKPPPPTTTKLVNNPNKLINSKPSTTTSYINKPVPKFIIQLGHSESDSDSDYYPRSDVEVVKKSEQLNPITNILRENDNASPPNIILESPNYSPAPPEEQQQEEPAPEKTAGFEERLDMFLKTVRNKIDQTNTEVAEKTKNKVAVPKQMIKTTAPVTPLAVRHLPKSSQLEYKRLVARMALLEKQKQARLKCIKNSKKNDLQVTFSNCSQAAPQSDIIVTVNNDKRNVQDVSSTLKPDTLMKKVLIKNTAILESQTSAEKNVSVDQNEKNEEEEVFKKPVSPVKVPQQVQKIEGLNVEKLLQQVSKKFCDMSVEDKQRILNSTERKYQAHSKQFLQDLTEIIETVSSAQRERQKQYDLENKIEYLKEKLAKLEPVLDMQKNKMSKIYPALQTSHKNIMSSRSKCINMNNICLKIGKTVKGDDYQIPSNTKPEILEKLKALSEETRKLKSMKKLTLDEFKIHAFGGTNQKNEIVEIPALPPPVIVEELSRLGKYNSPLDSLVSRGPNNPDGVICPFQLMGQCEDKDCQYEHFKI